MEIRAEKALEAIYVCCFGKDPINKEDERLLRIMINAVFPSVGQPKVDNMVSTLAEQVAKGEKSVYSEQKTLPKEAVQRQMKDLEFLKQNTQK